MHSVVLQRSHCTDSLISTKISSHFSAAHNMLRFVLLVIGSSSSVTAWSSATASSSAGRHAGMARRSLNPTTALEMTAAPPEEEPEDASIDGFELTMKTKKTLIFDDKTGRFFETTKEPEESVSKYQQLSDNKSFSDSNEMVPTEILFGNGEKKFPHVELAAEILASDFELQFEGQQPTARTMKSPQDDEELQTEQPLIDAPQPLSVVEQCYEAWNEREMTKAVNCFADDFTYQDSQYVGAFTNTNDLARHFAQQADLLPPGCQLVLETIAVDPVNGNIGTRFHIEEQDGSVVPLTRGCSFYTTNDNGLITSGFRVLEMLVKPRKQDVDNMVSSASRVFANIVQQEKPSALMSEPSASLSIIEQYFDAWNNRDMEAALDCFVEECVYQTEDPVFVETFKGKAALRDHLVKNASVLPSSCRIILDNLAIDPTNGSIGTRWHLEISGIAVPNMQGCSMYTTDLLTGLLTSGFDVTEAPVKLPKEAMALLSLLPGKGSLFGLMSPTK